MIYGPYHMVHSKLTSLRITNFILFDKSVLDKCTSFETGVYSMVDSQFVAINGYTISIELICTKVMVPQNLAHIFTNRSAFKF